MEKTHESYKKSWPSLDALQAECKCPTPQNHANGAVVTMQWIAFLDERDSTNESVFCCLDCFTRELVAQGCHVTMYVPTQTDQGGVTIWAHSPHPGTLTISPACDLFSLPYPHSYRGGVDFVFPDQHAASPTSVEPEEYTPQSIEDYLDEQAEDIRQEMERTQGKSDLVVDEDGNFFRKSEIDDLDLTGFVHTEGIHEGKDGGYVND